MELRHIRYFLAVAKERHFTRAAQGLGIGQPPLSQQIRDLEREIGVALFRRVPHGAALTEAGQAFYDRVRRMPGEVEDAVTAAVRAARGETGSLCIGFTGSTAFNAHIPQTIMRYRRLFPDVDVSLVEANSAELVRALHAETLDAAFLRPESVCQDGLSLHPVDREAMILVTAANQYSDGEPMRLEALKNENFVMVPRDLGPTLYDATLAACRDAGFAPKMGQSAPQIASVLALVAGGFGVAVVPASMRAAGMTGIVYHDILNSTRELEIHLATRRGDQSKTVATFVRSIKNAAPTTTPAG